MLAYVQDLLPLSVKIFFFFHLLALLVVFFIMQYLFVGMRSKSCYLRCMFTYPNLFFPFHQGGEEMDGRKPCSGTQHGRLDVGIEPYDHGSYVAPKCTTKPRTHIKVHKGVVAKFIQFLWNFSF